MAAPRFLKRLFTNCTSLFVWGVLQLAFSLFSNGEEHFDTVSPESFKFYFEKVYIGMSLK